MSVPTVILALAALLFGGLLGVLWQRARNQSALHSKERELVEARTQLSERETADEDRERRLKSANEQFQEQLENLASKALSRSQKDFLTLASERFGKAQAESSADLQKHQRAFEELVKPIRENLDKTHKTLHEMEEKRAEAQGKLHQEIERMTKSNKDLHAETGKLVTALRRPEVRGQWGEMQLRRLVEIAGMQEHCDFSEQPQASESRKRPDMIVKLPEGGQLVVDAKTPLDAYLNAVEADNDEVRDERLTRHAANVAKQIQRLASKEYWDQFERSPDFVVMFLPGDHFLAAAGDKQPDLMEKALRARVILATPTSMMALLRVTAYGWRQLALAKNAQEISKLATTLHERVAKFGEYFVQLGKQLNTAINTYNRAGGSFQRRLMPALRDMEDAGVQQSKEIKAPDGVATAEPPLLTKGETAEKVLPDPAEEQ